MNCSDVLITQYHIKMFHFAPSFYRNFYLCNKKTEKSSFQDLSVIFQSPFRNLFFSLLRLFLFLCRFVQIVFNQNIVSETGATVCLTGAYVNYVTDYEKMMNMDQFEKEQSAASELFTDKKAAQDLADSLNKSSMDISMIYPFADVGLFTVNYYDFQVVAIQ